jgi:hypothetical protein
MNKITKLLIAMFDADQHYIYHGPRETWDVLARANTAWLSTWIKGHGWPTIGEVGEKGAQAAWIIVQHSDHDYTFQKDCFELMTRSWEENHKNVNRAYIATLEDRININAGKPQRFGTQWDRDESGKLYLQPIKDETKMKRLRKEYGLPCQAPIKLDTSSILEGT